MANYEERVVSNYVYLRSERAELKFQALATQHGLECSYDEKGRWEVHGDNPNLIMDSTALADRWYWDNPSGTAEENPYEGYPKKDAAGDWDMGPFQSFVEKACSLLKAGQVLILQGVGSEKHRYVNGWALAINQRGNRVQMDLSDINDKLGRLVRKQKGQ